MSTESPKLNAYLDVVKWVEAEFAYDPGDEIVFSSATSMAIGLAYAIGLNDQEINAAVEIGKSRGKKRFESYREQSKREYLEYLAQQPSEKGLVSTLVECLLHNVRIK